MLHIQISISFGLFRLMNVEREWETSETSESIYLQCTMIAIHHYPLSAPPRLWAAWKTRFLRSSYYHRDISRLSAVALMSSIGGTFIYCEILGLNLEVVIRNIISATSLNESLCPLLCKVQFCSFPDGIKRFIVVQFDVSDTAVGVKSFVLTSSWVNLL